MLREEAEWFSKEISRLSTDGMFPMANIGSSTKSFREKAQPWIDEYIFNPLTENKRSVLHVDLKDSEGVDLAGDLLEPEFQLKLRQMRFGSVLCSNLLEHVTHPISICEAICEIVNPGGYIFLSTPFRYPYHPDPIDTMFRPTAKELGEMFPETIIVSSTVVSGGNYFKLGRGVVETMQLLIRPFLPLRKPHIWFKNRGYLPWIFQDVSAVCLVLQKR